MKNRSRNSCCCSVMSHHQLTAQGIYFDYCLPAADKNDLHSFCSLTCSHMYDEDDEHILSDFSRETCWDGQIEGESFIHLEGKMFILFRFSYNIADINLEMISLY